MTPSFTSAELALKLLSQLREGDRDTFLNQVLDRVEARIRNEYEIKPTAQQIYDSAMDTKVREILDGEPYRSQRQQWEKDRELFDKAASYMDWSLYSFWELKLKDSGFPEPAKKGCPDCKADYDEWIEGVHEKRLQPRLDALARNYELLNSTHQRYMDRLRRAKPPTPLTFRGSGGYVPEELP